VLILGTFLCGPAFNTCRGFQVASVLASHAKFCLLMTVGHPRHEAGMKQSIPCVRGSSQAGLCIHWCLLVSRRSIAATGCAWQGTGRCGHRIDTSRAEGSVLSIRSRVQVSFAFQEAVSSLLYRTAILSVASLCSSLNRCTSKLAADVCGESESCHYSLQLDHTIA
jgi:hypothetical protein